MRSPTYELTFGSFDMNDDSWRALATQIEPSALSRVVEIRPSVGHITFKNVRDVRLFLSVQGTFVMLGAAVVVLARDADSRVVVFLNECEHEVFHFTDASIGAIRPFEEYVIDAARGLGCTIAVDAPRTNLFHLAGSVERAESLDDWVAAGAVGPPPADVV